MLQLLHSAHRGMDCSLSHVAAGKKQWQPNWTGFDAGARVVFVHFITGITVSLWKEDSKESETVSWSVSQHHDELFTLNSLCGVNIHITGFIGTERHHPHIHVSLTVSGSHDANTHAASEGRNSNLLALAVNVTFRHVYESGREWWCNDVCFRGGGLCVCVSWLGTGRTSTS